MRSGKLIGSEKRGKQPTGMTKLRLDWLSYPLEFGLHHWWRGRSHKAQSFTAIAVASYVYHRFSNLVGRNSFSDGACADACLDNEFAESNLYLLTGRNDGEILLSDSPLTEEHLLEQTRAPSDLTPFEAEQWIPGALSDMRESWLSQMKMEVDIVNFIVDTGDLIWPLAIICLWAYSIYEGIRIFSGNEEKSSQSSLSMPSRWVYKQSILHSNPSVRDGPNLIEITR